MDKRQLGDRLRGLREAVGRSQEELARDAGVAQPSISKWETGQRLPDRKSITGYARALGVDPLDLMGWVADAAQEELRVSRSETEDLSAKLQELYAETRALIDAIKEDRTSRGLAVVPKSTPKRPRLRD